MPRPPLGAIREFLRLEASAGILLVAAAALAMVAANSPAAGLYAHFLETPLGVRLGEAQLEKHLLHWINDGLMAVFFLLVGLEIKREIVEGELSSAGQAALPLVAAVCGMAAPAAVYVAFTAPDAAALRGWAIPSATDIAFSLGVLSLLGARVPLGLKVFLTAVAVFDDLGAIVVIAVFYTSDLSWLALTLAAVPLIALVLLNVFGVRRTGPYMVAGVLLWLCVLESGVHATLAGVATALAIPRRGVVEEDGVGGLEHRLHPWVAYGILPLFAFANAGIPLGGVGLAELGAPVALGIAGGLFVGKQVGIFGAAFLMVKLGFARLPEGATWPALYGIAALCGIGFTMSLFIGTLAFADPGRAVDVRLGVMLGSLASALAGYLVLRACLRPTEE